VAVPIVFVALLALAATMIFALLHGTQWAAALSGGAIAGMLFAISWAMRHFLPRLSAAFVGGAGVPVALLWLVTPGSGLGGLAVAAAVFASWFLLYDLGVTARANRETVSEMVTLGTGAAGRALIVYHSTRGGFQPMVQRALAEGLQSHGWRVDMTTASATAPTDLSAYDLLVLGAPSYNWQPARPVLSYLGRIGDLKGLPVGLVITGGGMTDRAQNILRDRVAQAHGRIVEAIELWTARSNAERYGSSDPREIMRRAGARLALAAAPFKIAD
jgi:hypothetical protein